MNVSREMRASRSVAIILDVNQVLESAMIAYATDPSSHDRIKAVLAKCRIDLLKCIVDRPVDDPDSAAPPCDVGFEWDGKQCKPTS